MSTSTTPDPSPDFYFSPTDSKYNFLLNTEYIIIYNFFIIVVTY